MITPETILHITCQNKSNLHFTCQNKSKFHFYLVNHHPCLLRERNLGGRLPLYIACQNNDIVFVSWLLGNILAQSRGDVDDENSTFFSIVRARSMSDILSRSTSVPPNKSLKGVSPLSPVDIISFKPTNYIPSSDYAREDEDIEDFSLPHESNLRELGLLLSFESNRSFSYSFNEGSRSGSSEHSFLVIQSPLQSSGSVMSYDVTTPSCNETHKDESEEVSSGNGHHGDTLYGVTSAKHDGVVPNLRNSEHCIWINHLQCHFFHPMLTHISASRTFCPNIHSPYLMLWA